MIPITISLRYAVALLSEFLCTNSLIRLSLIEFQYANENVVNWLTTLADSFRVGDDMGKLRMQFKFFHKPFFSWKGSYVVTQVRFQSN